MKDSQKKRRFLNATIEDLLKDTDKYALDAAEMKDYKLLEQFNDLRPLVKAKEVELKELKWRKAFLLKKRTSRKF